MPDLRAYLAIAFMFWEKISELTYIILFILIVQNYETLDFFKTLWAIFILSINFIFVPNLVGHIFRNQLKVRP